MKEFSVPPVVTISEATNLTDPVWDNAETHPDTVQFVRPMAQGLVDVTCAQFRDEVVAVARGLVAAGIAPGERVGLMSRTRYEWTLFDYAIWTAGGVTVPVYETSSAEQVQWIMADAGARTCIVETAGHLATVQSTPVAAATMNRVWQIDPGDGHPGAVAELTSLGAAVEPADVERRRRSVRAHDLATIVYTSGTTGRPKGCMLTHRNIATDISNAIPGLPSLFREGAATVLFLPLAHTFARLIQAGVIGGRVRTLHSADTKHLVETLGMFQPTFVLAVPRVFEKVYNGARQKAHADGKGAIFDRAAQAAISYSEGLDRPSGPGLFSRAQHALFDRLVYSKLRAALGGQCTAAISGGAPLGSRLAHFFRGIGVTVYEGYGLSETSPAVSVNLVEHIRIGTVGRPLPGVTVRIADDGEVLVGGDIVFAGYWNNPEATAEAVDADGWFHTGDLGSLDGDGYLSITGRKKELIVTAGGKNVAPALLEDRIRAHALVSQCMVVGDRQPFIAALVTLDEEVLPEWNRTHGKPAETAPADLRDDPALLAVIQAAVDEANLAVSKAESIRVFRVLPGDFTETNGMLTPSMKVKRTVVAKEYADEIAAIYS